MHTLFTQHLILDGRLFTQHLILDGRKSILVLQNIRLQMIVALSTVPVPTMISAKLIITRLNKSYHSNFWKQAGTSSFLIFNQLDGVNWLIEIRSFYANVIMHVCVNASMDIHK